MDCVLGNPLLFFTSGWPFLLSTNIYPAALLLSHIARQKKGTLWPLSHRKELLQIGETVPHRRVQPRSTACYQRGPSHPSGLKGLSGLWISTLKTFGSGELKGWP